MTDKSQIVEQARLDILGEIADKSGLDMTDVEIKDILDNYFDGVPSKFTDLNQTINTKDGNYEVKLSEVLNGVKVKTELSVVDIKSKPDKFYGSEITNYTSENGYNTWKVFYADSSHIYLIASDYIEYDANLKGKGGNSFLQGTTTYNFKFGTNISDGVMQDYPNGTDEIVNTTYATAQEIKRLNSKYFAIFPDKRTENNKIAIASMLDTTVWKEYMDKSDKTGKAKYAIGGPTIEMLFNSYDEKYKLFDNQGKGKHQVDVSSENNTGYGYRVNANYGADGSWDTFISNSKDSLAKRDTLYVNQSTNTNANGYYIASPSAENTNNVMRVDCHGLIYYATYSNANLGFRPIVCLQSGVKIEKVEEGKYKIID